MGVRVCVHALACACMYLYVLACACVHDYMRVCACMRVYARVYACMCVYLRASACTLIFVRFFGRYSRSGVGRREQMGNCCADVLMCMPCACMCVHVPSVLVYFEVCALVCVYGRVYARIRACGCVVYPCTFKR